MKRFRVDPSPTTNDTLPNLCLHPDPYDPLLTHSLVSGPNVPAPRPSAATSVPSLLHSLQSEWDSLMLESLSLKLQYQSTRQELAHALYREDASLRVVARLVKERDQARECVFLLAH